MTEADSEHWWWLDAGRPGPKVFHGARARVMVGGQEVGVLNDISYARVLDAAPYVMGRLDPGEIAGQLDEPISFTVQGFRVLPVPAKPKT